MIEVKPLNTLTFENALEIWNKGFEGYVYDQKMGLDRFIQRFGNEELSPELSLVAFVDGKPAGIILNGLRTLNNKTISWNGGTGVATTYRHQGVGKALMNATFELYKAHKVDLATLEAASSNIHAINLYKKCGYSLIDDLVFLEKKEALPEEPFSAKTSSKLEWRKGIALEASELSIINDLVPWQTHWKSLRKDGELLVVSDLKRDVGYFLYRKQYASDGKLSGILLFSAGIEEGRSDRLDIARVGLKALFQPLDVPLHRGTFNFRSSNQEIIILLNKLGFAPSIEQVYMIKEM